MWAHAPIWRDFQKVRPESNSHWYPAEWVSRCLRSSNWRYCTVIHCTDFEESTILAPWMPRPWFEIVGCQQNFESLRWSSLIIIPPAVIIIILFGSAYPWWWFRSSCCSTSTSTTCSGSRSKNEEEDGDDTLDYASSLSKTETTWDLLNEAWRRQWNHQVDLLTNYHRHHCGIYEYCMVIRWRIIILCCVVSIVINSANLIPFFFQQ